MRTSRPRSRTTALCLVAITTLTLALSACSPVSDLMSKAVGGGPGKGAADVTFRPVIAATDMLSARNGFISSPEPVADVDAALANAERIVTQTITTAYPDIAASQPELAKEFLETECPSDLDTMEFPEADPSKTIVGCDSYARTKYLLGPSEVSGSDIDLIETKPGIAPESWNIALELNNAGIKAMKELSTRVSKLPSPESLAVDAPTGTLSALTWAGAASLQQVTLTRGTVVVSAPVMQAPIPDGKLDISGNFDKKGAQNIASQLSE